MKFTCWNSYFGFKERRQKPKKGCWGHVVCKLSGNENCERWKVDPILLVWRCQIFLRFGFWSTIVFTSWNWTFNEWNNCRMSVFVLRLKLSYHFIDCIASYHIIFSPAHVQTIAFYWNFIRLFFVVFDVVVVFIFVCSTKNEIIKCHMSHVMIFFTLDICRQIPIGQYRLIIIIRINGKSDRNFSKCLYDVNARQNWIVGRKVTDIEEIKTCVSNVIPMIVRNCFTDITIITIQNVIVHFDLLSLNKYMPDKPFAMHLCLTLLYCCCCCCLPIFRL